MKLLGMQIYAKRKTDEEFGEWIRHCCSRLKWPSMISAGVSPLSFRMSLFITWMFVSVRRSFGGIDKADLG